MEVTDKVMKDRKIVSHAVREKLSRPTQYSILYNTKKESDVAWTCPKNVTTIGPRNCCSRHQEEWKTYSCTSEWQRKDWQDVS